MKIINRPNEELTVLNNDGQAKIIVEQEGIVKTTFEQTSAENNDFITKGFADEHYLDGKSYTAGNGINISSENEISVDNAITNSISTIEGKIPAEASSSNQLADKAYVNAQGNKGFTVQVDTAFWQDELFFVYSNGTVAQIVTAATYNNVVAIGHTVDLDYIRSDENLAYYEVGSDSKIEYNGRVVVYTGNTSHHIKVILTNCSIARNNE